MYEVLNYESTLEILDDDGKSGIYFSRSEMDIKLEQPTKKRTLLVRKFRTVSLNTVQTNLVDMGNHFVEK